jgi:hypothetical protein
MPQSPVPSKIGTKHETGLHRDLKFSYAGQGGQTEADVAGYVADGINAAGEYIEIQTADFSSFKKKAKKLASQGKLRIVYPVILTKYIEVYDSGGKRLYRRKSPRHGSIWDIFDELVYAPELPLTPNLAIELVLVDAAEKRVRDGKGSWRRRGLSIHDRQLLAVHDRFRLKRRADYAQFVPFQKNEEFTSALLGNKAGINIALARKTLYVLTKIGIVEKNGKQRNAIVYRLVGSG